MFYGWRKGDANILSAIFGNVRTAIDNNNHICYNEIEQFLEML